MPATFSAPTPPPRQKKQKNAARYLRLENLKRKNWSCKKLGKQNFGMQHIQGKGLKQPGGTTGWFNSFEAWCHWLGRYVVTQNATTAIIQYGWILRIQRSELNQERSEYPSKLSSKLKSLKQTAVVVFIKLFNLEGNKNSTPIYVLRANSGEEFWKYCGMEIRLRSDTYPG